MKAVLVSLMLLLTTSTEAFADGATSLLFLSLEGARDAGYAGAGWMEAPRGLASSGPVFLVELGIGEGSQSRGTAMAGWRFSSGRTVATLLGGIEAGTRMRPKASADLWWDDAGWMATARSEATPDNASWRAAGGWRSEEKLPWIGPEISYKNDGLRLGAHATGLQLPGSFEARASSGWAGGDAYGELSLWRRF